MEREKKPYVIILVNQILKQKKTDISLEINKQIKEFVIPFEAFKQWTVFTKIVQSDAFQGQIKAIADSGIDSSFLIDGHLSIDLSFRKDYIPSYR